MLMLRNILGLLWLDEKPPLSKSDLAMSSLHGNWDWKRSPTGREMPLSDSIRLHKGQKYHPISTSSNHMLVLLAQPRC